MRLIDVRAFLDFDAGNAGPETKLLVDISGTRLEETEYAILSHCWGEPTDEVQYMEMVGLTTMQTAALHEIRRRSGYKKILKSSQQALLDDLAWLWVDTCCIDKQSSAELSEAINSMYAWYANSDHCYALLHDTDASSLPVQRDDKFSEFNGWPKWFSRGWTLQELVAPENVHFFNGNWEYIANKQSCAVALNIITQISVDVLEKGLGGTSPSVAQVMSWAGNRNTTREEDRAYSLMGLFGVHMPMLYGEGKNAFLRLQLEIIRLTNDQSIFAWGWTRDTGWASNFLADDPRCFRDCSNIVRMAHGDFVGALGKYLPKKELRKLASAKGHFQTFTVTNHGIQIWLPRQALKHDSGSRSSELFSVMLACHETGEGSGPITITMEQFGPNSSRYFYYFPVANWNRKSPVDFQQIFLPYRDNINLNIRGPLSRQCRLSQISVNEFMASDTVIIVLGSSGSGKSNIINKLIGIPPQSSIDAYVTCKGAISAFARIHKGRRFVFIDTPGFEPCRYKDILMYLHLIYQKSIRLTGVIYTHYVMVGRTTSEEHNLRVLANICGREAMDQVQLVTTMWDKAYFSSALWAEKELKEECWKPLLDAGACYGRFDNTPQSAWAIVESLGNQKKGLLFQREMVDMGTNLLKTSAFKEIGHLPGM